MSEKIRQTFENAFIETIKKAIQNKNVVYIVQLLEEINKRLNNLVPSRKDLHESLEKEVDLELIRQELEHDAFGATEFYQVMNAYLCRIEMFQATADKDQLDIVRTKLETLDGTMSWADIVAPFFLDINKLIDIIDQRKKDALSNPEIIKFLTEILK